MRVTDPNGQPIGTAAVAADGSYTVTLTTPQTGGGVLVVTQTDAAGNVSPFTRIDAVDTGTIAAATGPDRRAGHYGQRHRRAGATVIVRDANGQTIGQATVDANGNYSLTLTKPREEWRNADRRAERHAGQCVPDDHLTAPDFTAPEAPTATIAGDGAIITAPANPARRLPSAIAAGSR